VAGLQQAGWYLRSDIIWAKPNPMPESTTDRPTKAHEYVFLLTKSQRYFYDAEAVREPGPTYVRRAGGYAGRKPDDGGPNHAIYDENCSFAQRDVITVGRNRRSVWTIATQAFPEAHFATYPEDLVRPCILAGTSAWGCCPTCGAPWERIWQREYHGPAGMDYKDAGSGGGKRSHAGGESWARWKREYPDRTLSWRPTCKCGGEPVPCTVLDPFFGSGTTGLVALKLGRHAIGIELQHAYAEMARRRLTPELAHQPLPFEPPDAKHDERAGLFAADGR
jgi:hypothetical protein